MLFELHLRFQPDARYGELKIVTCSWNSTTNCDQMFRECRFVLINPDGCHSGLCIWPHFVCGPINIECAYSPQCLQLKIHGLLPMQGLQCVYRFKRPWSLEITIWESVRGISNSRTCAPSIDLLGGGRYVLFHSKKFIQRTSVVTACIDRLLCAKQYVELRFCEILWILTI